MSDASSSVDSYLRNVRAVIADAYTFVRSAESNQALDTVTLENLISDQIKRNGESALSNANQYNPYGYDPNNPPPPGQTPARANFAGGSDTSRPTKIDAITAIKNEVSATVQSIKDNPELWQVDDYIEAAERSPG